MKFIANAIRNFTKEDIGCYRSIEEIGIWSKLSPEARSTIMKELPGRAHQVQKRRGGRGSRLTK